MSRMALAATSLVAAVPAGIMAALAVMALLSSAGDMKPLVLGITGAASAVGVLIALLPIIILVGKRKTPAPAVKAATPEPASTDATGAQTAEIVAEDLDEAVGADEETEALSSADDIGATDDFQFEDDAFSGDELTESEPEPEPEPKKKKKKR